MCSVRNELPGTSLMLVTGPGGLTRMAALYAMFAQHQEHFYLVTRKTSSALAKLL